MYSELYNLVRQQGSLIAQLFRLVNVACASCLQTVALRTLWWPGSYLRYSSVSTLLQLVALQLEVRKYLGQTSIKADLFNTKDLLVNMEAYIAYMLLTHWLLDCRQLGPARFLAFEADLTDLEHWFVFHGKGLCRDKCINREDFVHFFPYQFLFLFVWYIYI